MHKQDGQTWVAFVPIFLSFLKAYLVACTGSGFLRENDIVVGDIGSSWFAALSMRLPSGCSMIHQVKN